MYGKTKINRLCGGSDAADFSGGGGLSLHQVSGRYPPRRQLRGQRRLYLFPLSSPARPGAEHGGQRTRPPHEPHQNRLHGLLPGHQRERLSVEPAGPHPRAGPGDRGRGGRCGAAGAVRPR